MMDVKYMSSIISLLFLACSPLLYVSYVKKYKKTEIRIKNIFLGMLYYYTIVKAGTQIILPILSNFKLMEHALLYNGTIIISLFELLFFILGYYVFYKFYLQKEISASIILSFSLGISLGMICNDLLLSGISNFLYLKSAVDNTLDTFFQNSGLIKGEIESISEYYKSMPNSYFGYLGMASMLVVVYNYFIATLFINLKNMNRSIYFVYFIIGSILFVALYYVFPTINISLTVLITILITVLYYLLAEHINSKYLLRGEV